MAEERIALVTGASRGVGRGVALGLAERGWTVVVTGRAGDAGGPSEALVEVAAELAARGGRGIPVACDHSVDEEVERLFATVDDLGPGPELLVNNVWAGPGLEAMMQPFWERPTSDWDVLVGLGLRAHYVASRLAAQRMVPRGRGLIANISSFGSRARLHSVPYGVSKVGLDKMAADLAVELAPIGVTAVSLWPGLVRTERLEAALAAGIEEIEGVPIAEAETPMFVGDVVAALADDPELSARNGHTLVIAELAAEYGITDEGGRQPMSHRRIFGGGPLFPPPTDDAEQPAAPS